MLDCKRPQTSILLLKPVAVVRCFGPGKERSWDSAWEYDPKALIPMEGPVVREAEIHARTLSLPIWASLFAKKLNLYEPLREAVRLSYYIYNQALYLMYSFAVYIHISGRGQI